MHYARTIGLLLLIALLFVGCGSRTWTKADSAREAAYLALHVADWGQTLDIADHPDKWHENNPALGSHPSRGEVNRYFAITGLLHPVISYALPDDWRPYWQYGTIGLEVICVGNNARMGIGFGF
jgi:hypothetical protein